MVVPPFFRTRRKQLTMGNPLKRTYDITPDEHLRNVALCAEDWDKYNGRFPDVFEDEVDLLHKRVAASTLNARAFTDRYQTQVEPSWISNAKWDALHGTSKVPDWVEDQQKQLRKAVLDQLKKRWG